MKFVLLLLSFAALAALALADVENAAKLGLQNMITDEIVPKIIRNLPEHSLVIVYGNETVTQGNKLTPRQVKEEPTEISWPSEANQLYTLIMIDPDAPTRKAPVAGPFNHWVVVNIKGNDWRNGMTMAGYRGSGPPQHTGFHRYIFLLYKQQGELKPGEDVIPKDSRSGKLSA